MCCETQWPQCDHTKVGGENSLAISTLNFDLIYSVLLNGWSAILPMLLAGFTKNKMITLRLLVRSSLSILEVCNLICLLSV